MELTHLKSWGSLFSFQRRIIEIFKLLGALHHQRYWLIIFQFNTSPFSFLLHIEIQFSMFLQVFVPCTFPSNTLELFMDWQM